MERSLGKASVVIIPLASLTPVPPSREETRLGITAFIAFKGSRQPMIPVEQGKYSSAFPPAALARVSSRLMESSTPVFMHTFAILLLIRMPRICFALSLSLPIRTGDPGHLLLVNIPAKRVVGLSSMISDIFMGRGLISFLSSGKKESGRTAVLKPSGSCPRFFRAAI